MEGQVRATDGRMIYRTKFNRWQVYFWIDGPVDEIKIVEVSRAK